MTVFLTTTETTDAIILQWHATEVGDIVDNPTGIGAEHPTLLSAGAVSLQIGSQIPQDFVAPHIIILPLNISYVFTVTVAPATVFCIYSKLTGAADEVRHLLSDQTVIFNTKTPAP